jgi:predicted RNA binding protein YcfA (HicA-like mRNA interferase family)
VKLSRDISGDELTRLLKKYGYQISRQTGSYIRLTSSFKNTEHHITIPHQKSLMVGTLNNILNNVAAYLEMDKKTLIAELFGE